MLVCRMYIRAAGNTTKSCCTQPSLATNFLKHSLINDGCEVMDGRTLQKKKSDELSSDGPSSPHSTKTMVKSYNGGSYVGYQDFSQVLCKSLFLGKYMMLRSQCPCINLNFL